MFETDPGTLTTEEKGYGGDLDESDGKEERTRHSDISPLIKKARRDHPVLTKEEQLVLIEKAKGGDESARNEQTLRSLGLVLKGVRKYRHLKNDFEDIVQEGIISLMMDGIKGHDADKGAFSTHVSFWIRSAGRRYIFKNSTAVKFPIGLREIEERINKFVRRFYSKHGIRPTIEEIAIGLGKKKKVIEDVLRHQVKMIYPSDRHSDEVPGEKFDFITDFPDVDSLDPLQKLIARETLDECIADIRIVVRCLGNLSRRNQAIFLSFYGMEDDLSRKTLEKTGEVFKISRERVRQVVNKVFGYLIENKVVESREAWENLIERLKLVSEVIDFSFEELLEQIFSGYDIAQ